MQVIGQSVSMKAAAAPASAGPLFEPCALCDGYPVSGGYIVNGLFYTDENAGFCVEHEMSAAR